MSLQDVTAVHGITPEFARELAETWTQKTPVAKAEVYNTLRSMDAQGVCRVVQAIDGMYGQKHGPIQMRVFLQELLASYPPVDDTEEAAT